MYFLKFFFFIFFAFNTCAKIKGSFIFFQNPSKILQGVVVKIKDGDSVVLLIDNQEVNVRLAHIDAPEKKQAFGQKSRQYLAQLCFQKKVFLKGELTHDRYGRLIAELVLSNGENVNKKMIKEGYAWHFKKYSKDRDYDDLERWARARKLQIWSEKNPVSPWDWRRERRGSKQKS